MENVLLDAGIPVTILRPCAIHGRLSDAIGISLPLVPIDGPPQGAIGSTPWSPAGPFVLDCVAAEETGWTVPIYTEDVRAACDRMLEIAARDDWRKYVSHFPSYQQHPFNYAAKDESLRQKW